MSETTETGADAPADQKPAKKTAAKRGGGLNTMLLADLKSMAGGLGVKGTGSMKKAQLVDAIRAAQSSSNQSNQSNQSHQSGQASTPRSQADQPRQARQERQQPRDQQEKQPDKQSDKQPDKPQDQPVQRDQSQVDGQPDDQPEQGDQQDGEGGSRRNRRRRGRDRTRAGQGTGGTSGSGGGGGGGGGRNEPDTTILEDDVLVPAAGILDVLDNYAFVRTGGYLAGPDDVYLSLSMVRKFGLRRGDAVVGQVRQPREGERREKFNPMVRIDSVNGADPDAARHRPEFAKLTPLHPTERLRLERGPDDRVGRVIDLVAPVGKGQRGLIVSPARAGKTTILQSIAAAVTANNPECHLMVVLLDERPEEVTDFQRSVKGEVVASTFDRPPADHTVVAELAIERAKRLVELGHDVVVLLDGITRLGQAYNLSAPANGRSLAGGVDASALYPPKRFFGAARNLEDGGSLTILATASVESGSATDEVIFEEFTGTENADLLLRRDLADKRIFPAVDVVASSTRHEEDLLGHQELEVVRKVRRVLADLAADQGADVALELLLQRIEQTQTNVELLMTAQKAAVNRI